MQERPSFEKRQDFLFIVQSAYLGNGINSLGGGIDVNSVRHLFSGRGITNEMCDAIKASHLIPANVDAVTAADDYVTWKLLKSGNPDQHKSKPRWITVPSRMIT